MKTLHIITGLNVGGAETMLARLLEHRDQSPDILPEVISLMAPGLAGRRIALTGTPIHSLGMRGGVPSLTAAMRLMKLTQSIAPDLIIGWMHHGQIAATLAAMVSKTPMLWNVRHSLSGYGEEKPMTRALLRLGAWLSRKPAAIIYNSRIASQQYGAFGYCARRAMVIPNGFDRSGFAARAEGRSALRSRLRVPADALVIGAIARNHPMKDVPNLLAAFAQVRRVRNDAHLLVVGDAMDRPSPAAERILATLPPASWTLADHRSDVSAWLAGLDILALPSAWGEGFPNIVGEAMACGVPCVGTDVGDTGWVIGSTGIVVPPRDSRALAAALIELAELGEDGRLALGRAAQDRVDGHFALPAIVQDYAALFREHARVSWPTPAIGGATAEADVQ